MIHDDLLLIHYGSIDPLWIYLSNGSTIDPLWICWFILVPLIHYSPMRAAGSEIPTHFLQEPLDGASWGHDTNRKTQTQIVRWPSNDIIFLKLPKFQSSMEGATIRKKKNLKNRGTTRRICTAASLEACDDLRFLDLNHLSSYADI